MHVSSRNRAILFLWSLSGVRFSLNDWSSVFSLFGFLCGPLGFSCGGVFFCPIASWWVYIEGEGLGWSVSRCFISSDLGCRRLLGSMGCNCGGDLASTVWFCSLFIFSRSVITIVYRGTWPSFFFRPRWRYQ